MCNLNIELMRCGRDNDERCMNQTKNSICESIRTRSSLSPTCPRLFRKNLTDPSLQDNVLIPSDYFEHICHIGCAIKIDVKKTKLEQKTNDILHVCGSCGQRTEKNIKNCVFFFLRARKSVSQLLNYTCPNRPDSQQVAVVPHDLMDRRLRAINSSGHAIEE